jgi:hypothetical protein
MAEAVRIVNVMCSVFRRALTEGVDALGVKKGRLRRDAVEGDLRLSCSRSARVKVLRIAVRGIDPHTAWVSVRYTRSKVELAYSDIHTCPGIHPCDGSTVLHLLLGVV